MTMNGKLRAATRVEVERSAWVSQIEMSMRSVDEEIARVAQTHDTDVMHALRVVRSALERGVRALGELPH